MSGGDVSAFNELSEDHARAGLTTCLNVPRWVDTVLAGRPFADMAALHETASAAAAHLDDAELERALAGHPRIGEKASSPDHDAELSRREQGGVDPADTNIVAEILAGNQAYEAKFDRVFLIRAAGRSATQIRDELHRRLDNDEASEREETVAQLREIALLRLRTLA
ncbi:MAG: 2-oxo-4-hydroxy-4-carboxy-5-ureidoimidazoline decarboxylase [Ornithinimicrobium sp.]